MSQCEKKKNNMFANLILALRKSFCGQKVNILLFFTEQYPSIHNCVYKLFSFIRILYVSQIALLQLLSLLTIFE